MSLILQVLVYVRVAFNFKQNICWEWWKFPFFLSFCTYVHFSLFFSPRAGENTWTALHLPENQRLGFFLLYQVGHCNYCHLSTQNSVLSREYCLLGQFGMAVVSGNILKWIKMVGGSVHVTFTFLLYHASNSEPWCAFLCIDCSFCNTDKRWWLHIFS